MTKTVTWMQGFDHLPSFTETTFSAFSSFVTRMALIPIYTMTGGTTQKGKIGTATVAGLSYKGINLGIVDYNFTLDTSFAREDYLTKRIWAGLRISGSDSDADPSTSSYHGICAELRAASGTPYPNCLVKVPGGAFSVYVEVAIDFFLNKAFFFVDGQEVGIGTIATTEKSVRFSMADGTYPLNSGSVDGIGFVYSDFYLATEANGEGAPNPTPYGGLIVKSEQVATFSGDAGYYNTLGLDIVTDLNSIYDATYMPVGGYLHTPTTTGTIKYTPFDSSDNILALQVSTLITPPVNGGGLNQTLYFGDAAITTVTNEYITPANAFRPHVNVSTFDSDVTLDTLNTLNARIAAY